MNNPTVSTPTLPKTTRVKGNSNKSLTIARKEIRDALTNRTFLVILLLLAGLILTSILVSTLVFKGQLDQYNLALESLKAIGKTPAGATPELFPLNLLRGVVDYAEIIGALLTILLGYLSIAKEKHSKTLVLLLTRPVTKLEIVQGKLLGNYLLILGFSAAIGVIICLALLFIGGVALSGVELFKVLLFVLLVSAYLMTFFTLSFFLSLQQKNITKGLIMSLLVWLAFVLILPQIGDTMDPDNQVPGGFFSALNLDKSQEKLLMTKFSTYEFVRTGLEQLSVTKHFERASFALFGIKKQYNGMPLGQLLWEQTYNFVFVLGLLVVGWYANRILFTRKRIL